MAVNSFLDDRRDVVFLGLHNVDVAPGRKNVVLVDDLRALLEDARREGWSFSFDGPGRKMILTFDDGRVMYPEFCALLDEYDVTGLFFVCTDAVINSYPSEGPDGAPFTEENLAYLLDRHMVGSHTRDHRDLSRLDRGECLEYLGDSFDEFERVVGERPTLFSYPWGKYNRATLSVLDELGISHAFLAGAGRETPLGHRYLIPRVFLDFMPREELSLEKVLSDDREPLSWLKVQVRNLLAVPARV